MTFIMRLSTFVLISSTFLFSQQTQQIVVTGRSELKVLADQAAFSFTVSAFGPNLRKAVEETRNKAKGTTAKLFEIGFKPHQISTTYFHSGENYGSKPFLSSSEDFGAFITTNVVLDSLPLLEEALLLLSELNVDNIYDISFSLKDVEHHRLKAIQQAIDDAQRKAEQIASQTKVSIKRLISIEEQPSRDEPVPLVMALRPLMARQGRTEPPGGFYSQHLVLLATVKVTFEFQ